METRDEILQQYENDKRQKILQLQTAFAGRAVQSAKQSATINNNISVINTVATADDFLSKIGTNILGISGTSNRNYIFSIIRKEILPLFSNEDDVFAYVALECICSLVSSDTNKITINYSIIEHVLLKLPNSGTSQEIFTGVGGVSKIEIPINTNTFVELKKELSGFTYPITNLSTNNRFSTYLDLINTRLKAQSIPPLDSISAVGFCVFDLGDFNSIFPAPDGLVTTPVIPTTPTVPTTPVIPITPTVPTTPVIPTTPTVPTIPSITSTSSVDGNKYLSIEAIKDDDPIVETPSTSTQVISLRFIDDDQNDQYYNRNELTSIKTEVVSNKRNDLPNKPLGDKNQIVLNNEKKEIDRRTKTQRNLEESDGLQKEKPKEKLSTGVSGPNPKLKNGKISDQDKRKDKPDSKKEEAVVQQNGNPLAKYFLEWHKTDGVDPNGIIYRGNRDIELTKNTSITDGSVEKRYKNLFEFGTNLKKMFSGIKIESPIDIGLALNGIQIGLFNKNIPYMFGEGSEVHAAIIGSGVIDRESEGGIGNYGKNANWGNEPFWCGYFTDFVLNNNGIYKSDQDRKSIIGTNSVYRPNGYYDDSTFNYIPNVVDDDIRNLQNDIRSKNREINKNDEAIEKLKKTEKNLKTKIEKEQSKISGLGRTPPGLQRLDIEYNKVVGELRGLETLNTNLERSKQSSQSALDKKTNVLQSSIYNEGKNVAVFYRGYHIGSDNSLTPRGKELLEKIKSWPGGYIVTDTGHVEVLLHISKSGKIYTLGGNTGITLLPYKGGDSTDIIKQRANPAAITKNDLANGYQYGFKMKSSFGAWAGGNFYIVKRGVKSPYTNGIGVGLIKTETWKKYEDIVKSKKDNTVSPMAYNIMKDAFSS
jgi:hypothetical protein